MHTNSNRTHEQSQSHNNYSNSSSNSNSNSHGLNNAFTQSQCHRCPICNNSAYQPINMRCDHHPCYQCAIPLLQLDQQNQKNSLQNRYKIICPVSNCHKKTITYDLRHLIINNTQMDQDMYVTNKYVTKKVQAVCNSVNNSINNSMNNSITNSVNNSVSAIGSRKSSLQLQTNNININNSNYNSKNNVNNYMAQPLTTPKAGSNNNSVRNSFNSNNAPPMNSSNNGHGYGHSKHNSQGTINLGSSSLNPTSNPQINNNINNSNRSISIQCKQHRGHNLQYICEDCLCKNMLQSFMCAQCLKSHKLLHASSQSSQSSVKILQISSSQTSNKLAQLNLHKKQSLHTSKSKQIQSWICDLAHRKQQIQTQFQIIYRELNEQFKLIYQSINDQYQNLKKQLKTVYTKQCQDIKNSVKLVQNIRDSLQELDKINIISNNGSNNGQIKGDLQAQVQYTMCVFQIQKAIQNGYSKGKLMNKIEALKLVRCPNNIFAANEKIFEFQYSSSSCLNSNTNTGMMLSLKSKQQSGQSSRVMTPTGSARFFNCSLDCTKNPRIQQALLDISHVKQNMNLVPMVSPKNYASNSHRNKA